MPEWRKDKRWLAVWPALLALPLCAQQLPPPTMEEVRVWGERGNPQEDSYPNPRSVLRPEDARSLNITTTEDLVKYAPSLIIRRRFIGDANGTLGIRGSNMFQTARSMVFADGVPLHYFLESRWNGAPRWTLVSASEIARVEVLYGPFSAEYSGNAMGGVVNIETAIPEKRTIHFDGSLFSQNFDAYGFDDRVGGYKGFASYGDRLGDLSLYLSYNHLSNESQPQSFYYGGSTQNDALTPVTGAIPGPDTEDNTQLYFGDTGVVETTTDNFKLKLGYDWDDWSALFNLAYEDRQSETLEPNTYVRDSKGEPLWGGELVQGNTPFSMPASRLNVGSQERDSLSSGLRLRGELNEALALEANLSHFAILRDETRSSAVHPEHPEASPTGQITDYDDTGWHTAEVKLRANPQGLDQLSLVAGARHEAYELNINVHQSDDYRAGHKGAFTSRSGGRTRIDALYAQLDWQLNPRWNLSLGGRHESWQSRDGYFANDREQTPEFDLETVPGSERQRFSPKFSLGFQPGADWQLRYSAARAYRFPLVEELFSQYRAYNTVSEANPALKPEDGLHHNLMLERQLTHGVIRLNIFQESIDEVIESQTTLLPGGGSIRTFVPIDRVDTRGAEFIANLGGLWLPELDLRFNLTYTHAEIARNSADPSTEGNRFPRMPRWRGNITATYQLTERWDLGGSVQYASNSFGQLDNRDKARYVYGAQDSYRFLGLKTNVQATPRLTLSAGVDNLTDERAYVAHPWPGRTLYFNVSYRH